MARPGGMRRRRAGFTLVEVLVALTVMALMAALAWRGVDGVLRSRDASREVLDRHLLLATWLSQWETDLQSLHADSGLPDTLRCDGRSLRLVRRTDGGLQVVIWSLHGSSWQRWASPAATRAGELKQAWMRSLQLQGPEPEQLRLFDGASDVQIHFFRGNAWTNCQSTGDLQVVAAPGPASAASAPARTVEQLPTGVRLMLQIDGQQLTRDIAIAPGA